MNVMLNVPLEIVGLQNGENGRVCGLHPTACGMSVIAGTKLKLCKRTIPRIKSVIIANELVKNNAVVRAKYPKGAKTTSQQGKDLQMIDHDTIGVYIYTNNI